jgi:hypothetical protein
MYLGLPEAVKVVIYDIREHCAIVGFISCPD